MSALNWEISGLNALEMCQWIRKADLKLETHIIVLTERTQRRTSAPHTWQAPILSHKTPPRGGHAQPHLYHRKQGFPAELASLGSWPA